MSIQKVGVFDSGVGGLTVLRELARRFPELRFDYLGDTARLPYGVKSPATIRQYSVQILDFLLARGVDAIVIACNTASSQVPEAEWKGLPIFSVIGPGSDLAARTSQTGRIGVLATRTTVEADVYGQRLRNLRPEVQVFSQAAPLLVPLAEEGWMDDPVTFLVLERYLKGLLEQNIDTLILGCTHYPLLRAAIQKVCGKNIRLIESGIAVSEVLAERFHLPIQPTSMSSATEARINFMATDLSQHTQRLAESLLHPLKVQRFELVALGGPQSSPT